MTIPHEKKHYNAWPGTGFLDGIGILTLGFMRLGPGGEARRAMTWLAEFDRGRPICGGGAI